MSLANIIIEQIGAEKWVGHVEAGLGANFRRTHSEVMPSLIGALREVLRVYNERMGIAQAPPLPSLFEVAGPPSTMGALEHAAAVERSTRKPRKPMSEEQHAAARERGRRVAAIRWGKRDQPAESDSSTVD